jgi:hypothetical protein
MSDTEPGLIAELVRGGRCCVVGCEKPPMTNVKLWIFDTTHTKQEAFRPFCEEHAPVWIGERTHAR